MELILSKVPLTWTSSHPGVVSRRNQLHAVLHDHDPVSRRRTVTASCSPPTCNVGFPHVPASLSTQTQIDACTQFFQATSPAHSVVSYLIPMPVSTSTVSSLPAEAHRSHRLPVHRAVVTGASSAASVFAIEHRMREPISGQLQRFELFLLDRQSFHRRRDSVSHCSEFLRLRSARRQSVHGKQLTAQRSSPRDNSIHSNNPFTPPRNCNRKGSRSLNERIDGSFLRHDSHSQSGVCSRHCQRDGILPSLPWPSPNATTAAFSPDELKTFIVGGTTGSSLYVYSTLQALQGSTTTWLSDPQTQSAFSPNGAFAFVAEVRSGSRMSRPTAPATIRSRRPLPFRPTRF